MHYGDILERSAQITWRNKILWVFGIVAAVFGGAASSTGGNGGSGLQFMVSPADISRLERNMPWIGGVPEPESVFPIVAAVVGFLILFALVMLVVSVIARYTCYAALIGMVNDVEESQPITLRSGLEQGWRHFLRIFVIDLLLGLAGFVVALPVITALVLSLGLVIAPAVALGSGGNASIVAAVLWGVITGIAWLGVLVLCIVVLSGLFALLREFAFRASTLDNRGIFEALGDAWRLLYARFKESALMWLVLRLVNLAFGFVLFPLFVVGMAVALAGAAVAAAITGAWIGAAIVGLPLLALGGLVVTAITGIYQTFVSAAWTLAYRELRPSLAEAETA